MIERIQIVGARGRVGSAVSARLAERGLMDDSANPELVLLCVPDRAIGEVAAGTPVGPWIAHVSGATPLDALEPHVLRFGLHPLQSFSKAGAHGRSDAPARAHNLDSLDHFSGSSSARGYRAAEVCLAQLALGKPRVEVRSNRGPVVVRHAVPRAVAVLALADEHVLAVDSLERRPERLEGTA